MTILFGSLHLDVMVGVLIGLTLGWIIGRFGRRR